MSPPNRHPVTGLGRVLLLGWSVTSLGTAGCSDSAGPASGEDRYSIHADPAVGTLEIQHVAASERSAGIDLVPSNVTFDALAHELRVHVALHSGRAETFLAPRGVESFELDAGAAWPLNAGCSPPIPGDLPPLCVFWHWDSYGDRMLSSGETSEPVEWIFRVPAGAPFDFSARLWWPHGR